jgi:hypothetical protein
MTLKEAQKKWDDAIEMKYTHTPYSITEQFLEKAAQQSWKEPVKVLFVKSGKTKSRIIYSRMAAKEEARQLSLVPGTKVRMTGLEAHFENLRDIIYTVIRGPELISGKWAVCLDKYGGAYCCEYLQKVEENESR